jgi:DnaJ-class molecular chaperone
MRDPYLILGVPKGATAGDIKKAFRRLAKQYHPDQSTEPKAKEKFAEASAAYEILGDEKKRGAFDRGEIDAEGKPKFQGFDGFSGGADPRRAGAGAEHFEFNFGGRPGRGGPQGFDPGDIFADLFGGRSGARAGAQAHPAAKGEDVQANVSVSLADSVHGTKARVSLPTGRDLEISVPAGIEEGQQIRLKGQGQQSPLGGPPGDAIVTVHIAKHPFFRVEGHDLRLELPITLYEAVLGAKVNVPTLENAVELGIPAGSNGARTLRLRGKGLPQGKSGRGDLLVSLKVILPDDAKDDLESLARTLASKHAYDPRKGLG